MTIAEARELLEWLDKYAWEAAKPLTVWPSVNELRDALRRCLEAETGARLDDAIATGEV